MKSRDILSSVILIGAAIFVAATIFITPSKQKTDLELYGWLFDDRDAPEKAAKANATPVRVYETPKALGDQLWSILTPKEHTARFSGTGGSLSLLRVSTGAGTGSEGNALLISDEFKAAADGALSGTEDGIAALLAYFDAAGGNETIIAFRAQLLLEALTRDSASSQSLTSLQEATTNISEAAFTALWSGYVMPANFQADFALPPGSIGYDLGAVMLPNGEINPVYDDFIRVPADSNHIEGSAHDVESSPQLLWGDGVQGLTVFTAPIPNGTYKVYVLTSSEAGIDPSVAFGTYNTLKRDGRLRRIDLRDRQRRLTDWRDENCGCGKSLADQLRFLTEDERALPEDQRQLVVEKQLRERQCACGASRSAQERYLTDAQRALPDDQRQAILDKLWRERGCESRNQAQLEQAVYNPADEAAAQLAGLGTEGARALQCRMQRPSDTAAAAEILMSRQGISPEIEPELSMAALAPDQTRGYGAVYALREEVKNGQLYIDFNQGAIPSYVVGIIVIAADDSFGAQMSAMVSAVLETVHPAAGEGSQGPGLATNFAATTLPTGSPGGGGPSGGASGNPGGGIPTGPGATTGGDGDGGGGGDGTGGDGTGGGGDGGGGSGGDGTGGDGDGGGGNTPSLVAEGLGPYQGNYGDMLSLDGTTSTIDGVPIGGTIPPGLLVEWLFDLDGNGTYETLISNDLFAQIDSTVFGGTGEFQGILRLTLNGLVSIDQVLVILLAQNGGAVPEPGMLLMLALAFGLLLLAYYRRRRAA
jgi:hypothetical protein